MSTSVSRTSVVVIGAGVSGLAAARALVDDEWEVVVLEARDRVGGRVWSNRAWPGVALDMGAGWLVGHKGNPLSKIVKDAGIATLADDDSEYLYLADGTEVDDDEWDAQEARFQRVMAEVDKLREKRSEDGEADLPLQTAIDQVLPGLRFTEAQKRALDYDITRTVESDYAEDSTAISCFYWDNDGGFEGDDLVFPGGYDQVPKALARGLDVRLEHVVSRVEHSEDGVRVTTSKGVFEADYAIVTVPLGVLKRGSIAFSPPLSKKKRAAIEKLGMGLLNRVYLRFPRVFWEKDSVGFGVIPRRKDEWTEFVNFHRIVGEPILLCFNSGNFARRVEELTDEQTVAGMMETLRGVFGKDIPNPTASLVSRWSKDPFAFGSYSYMAVGATPAHVEALAAPEGCLFFAGEATSDEHPATVHGALLAGRRAAEELSDYDEDE